VVDQTTMTTPGVSHPSTTTVEDFHRVLDGPAVQPVFQPLVVVEVTDALVIAEGIETIKHAREAVAAGATIGQGFVFGYPAPLPTPLPPPGAAIPLRAPAGTAVQTLWEVVAAARAPRRATKDLLVEMSMQLEHQVLDAAEPDVLLACFQEADHFTPADRRRFEFLATRAAFTGALGHDLPVSPVAGVRGADLDADDPLRREWARS
jgi:hypothetical protein